MKFDFEKSFDKSEFIKFTNAIGKRVDYNFCYGKHGDKMIVKVYGSFCNNGVWLPQNYYWSIGTTDCRNGFSGSSYSFRIDELKTYDEIIAFVYSRFNLPKPTNYQTSLFD